MTTPTTPHPHAELLNCLVEMQEAFPYAARKVALCCAENVIVSLSAKVEALTEERDAYEGKYRIILQLRNNQAEYLLKIEKERDAALQLAAGRLEDAERWRYWRTSDGKLDALIDGFIKKRDASCPPPIICHNCDTALPEGCKGLFLDDGDHCRFGKAE